MGAENGLAVTEEGAKKKKKKKKAPSLKADTSQVLISLIVKE